jgi:hypothetical protein
MALAASRPKRLAGGGPLERRVRRPCAAYAKLPFPHVCLVIRVRTLIAASTMVGPASGSSNCSVRTATEVTKLSFSSKQKNGVSSCSGFASRGSELACCGMESASKSVLSRLSMSPPWVNRPPGFRA